VLVPAYRRQACKLWTKLFDFRSSATPSGHGVLPPCKYLLLNDWLPGFYLIPQYNATLNFQALFRPHPFSHPEGRTPQRPGILESEKYLNLVNLLKRQRASSKPWRAMPCRQRGQARAADPSAASGPPFEL